MRQPIKNDHPGRFTPRRVSIPGHSEKSPTHCQLCYEGWLCWLNLTSSVGFCTAERRAQKLLVVGANSHALVRFWQRWITCYREQALVQEQECGPSTFRRCLREVCLGPLDAVPEQRSVTARSDRRSWRALLLPLASAK